MRINGKLTTLALGLSLMLLPLLFAGPAFAQCTMTTANLDAELGNCSGDDLACYASTAKKFPSCAENIVWVYMMLFRPKNTNDVLTTFGDELPEEYYSRLSDVVTDASQVVDAAEKAGTETAYNEYPAGQGVEYGK